MAHSCQTTTFIIHLFTYHNLSYKKVCLFNYHQSVDAVDGSRRTWSFTCNLLRKCSLLVLSTSVDNSSRRLVKISSTVLDGQQISSVNVGEEKSAKIAKIPLINFVHKLPQRFLEVKFISLLQLCKTPKHLHQIQTQIITRGFQHNDFITSRFIAVYGEQKKMGYARQLFDQIPDRGIALWNAMFRGYAKSDSYKEVLILFSQMWSSGVIPNRFTFPIVLKSCGKVNALVEGQEIHGGAIKGGFGADQFVGTTLIDMYAGWGAIGAASKVFGEMVERNVVAWTSIISGYILCRDMVSARRLFDSSPVRDVVLWSIMVSGYIEVGDMLAARRLFDVMPNRDVMSWNAMLNGYANNGDIEECEKLFEEMPGKNIFSWNGLLGGYAHNGRFFEVLETFKRMLIEGNVRPNDVTLMTVLSACARLGAIGLGTWVHLYAESNGYKENLYVGNSLIDMYAKCGIIEKAVDVFKAMDTKDLITWNSIINALATHGRGNDALALFCQMKNAGEVPDGITFIGVLCACAHMGLVEDGFSYFTSMFDDYSIVPQIEHYGCMVDLLARAGLLDQAVEFVKKMTIEADAIIWAALLGACRIYKNVELGELALEHLIRLEPKNPANFVTLSNIYGDLGRWKDVARLKVAMRDTGSRKLPGCSLIEVNDSFVEFYSLDERHPEREEIYRTLRGLTKLLRSSGCDEGLLELGQVT